MERLKTVTTLVILIIIFSAFAAGTGITSGSGTGKFEYQSIREKRIEIFGTGIYRHMSSDVAIQGIAQDYITIFIAIPLLIISLIGFRKESTRSSIIMAGTLAYFLVTYLFYMTMAMYNELFIVYVILLALSFFALFIVMTKLKQRITVEKFSHNTPRLFVGYFLIINSISIALLWLGVIIPPILDGTVIDPDRINRIETHLPTAYKLMK